MSKKTQAILPISDHSLKLLSVLQPLIGGESRPRSLSETLDFCIADAAESWMTRIRYDDDGDPMLIPAELVAPQPGVSYSRFGKSIYTGRAYLSTPLLSDDERARLEWLIEHSPHSLLDPSRSAHEIASDGLRAIISDG